MRAILLTPEREVLLLRITPHSQEAPFWATPGGGASPGETHAETLRRELEEELKLRDFVLGPLVWRRRHTFRWGEEVLRQHESFYIVHVERFSPTLYDAQEAAFISEVRWWSSSALLMTDERLSPRSLATIVRDFLSYGAPTSLALEVVEDA